MKHPIVHFEIPVDDVERAQKFYNEIFGWTFHPFDMPADSSTGGDTYYGVTTTETDENQKIKRPGAINGGMMKRKMPHQPFMNYIEADDISKTLEEVQAHGGTIIMPKTEIAKGMGWIAAFKDTEGNPMGLHEMDLKIKECVDEHGEE